MTTPVMPEPLTGAHDERPRLPPPKPQPPDAATRAQRIAGGLLLINAAFVLIEAIVLKDPRPSSGSSLASPRTWVITALIDLVIGVSLLRGKRTLATWAIVRSAGGLLFGVALHLSTKNPLAAIMAAVLCASLLLLLIGQAGKVRIGFALAGTALMWLIEIVGLSALLTGVNPTAKLQMRLTRSIESDPAKRVTGVSYPYTLDTPNDQWYLHRAIQKDNPSVDQGIVRPDIDMYVIVIAEHVPGSTIPIDAFASSVIANHQRTVKNFSVEKREPWSAYPRNGRFVRATGTAEGIDLLYFFGLVTVYERAFQVIGFAPRRAPADRVADILQIIDTLKLPPDARELPPDLESEPASEVLGVSYGYTVQMPNDKWHMRTAEAIKRDNPTADRWIVRPDMDAHILIVAEHEPGLIISIDAYADAVLDMAKTGTKNVKVIDRKPWRAAPESGILMRTTSTNSGVDFEHCYGLVSIGDRAFQVIGFVASNHAEQVRGDILQIVESFKLPARENANPAAGARRGAGN